MAGKLTLVGAGPGDPELFTLKGVKVLNTADVVLYDALVHPDLLAYAGKKALKIFVGKRAGKHSLIQDEINALIVEHGKTGKHVVRLKGGDPFIFARGKEEIQYAEKHGIPAEVVLGISSINLPGYYGIPLTSRGINQSFWAITATTRHGELSKDVALAASSSATVLLFMGLKKLEEITSLYKQHKKDKMPVAIISKGSLKEGAVFFGTIETILSIRDSNKIEAPALVVIGEAVGTHEYFYDQVAAAEGKALPEKTPKV